jgi:hypothetical protein
VRLESVFVLLYPSIEVVAMEVDPTSFANYGEVFFED